MDIMEMDFATIINGYQAMQARAESLLDHPEVTWIEGSWGKGQIYTNDIDLDLDESDEYVRCSGTFWTNTTGGSNEIFEFRVPVDLMAEALQDGGN